jgi:hypothetical protein
VQATLTPTRGAETFLKQARSQFKLAGTRTEFRLIFPGAIVSSDLPEKEGSSTGILVDGKTDESLDVALKIHEKPVVITAQAGGLKVPEPLDSRTLREPQLDPLAGNLPVTDAGPGFVAEPLALTIQTLHVFPEGKLRMRDDTGDFGQRPGVSVNAKLFAPKGRLLLSTTGIKVLSARDDKGRPVGSGDGADETMMVRSYTSTSSGEDSQNSAQIDLQLALPAADAQAIDEVTAEAIAITAGGWKQITLTNVQAASTNEIDLGEILPGAKMAIKQVTDKSRQLRVQTQFSGPEEIRRLDVQLSIPGNDRAHSYSNERRASKRSGVLTRTVDAQLYSYDSNDEAPVGAATLVVRYPQELRRERVRFTLKGLDLL